MSDDQKPNLNPKIMSTIMENLRDCAKQMPRPDDFHLMLTRGESLPPFACGHAGQWGSQPLASIHGVQVVTSEHVPPDTMILVSRPPDQIMRPDWPSLTLNPKEGLNEHAPTWEPNFTSLLRAAGQQIINTNRGHFNTIICADDSPILPERPFVCWTCGDVFLSRKRKRQCAACLSKFYRDRDQVMHDLKMIGHTHFHLEIKRLGKPCPTHNWPNPPYLTAKQTREKLAAAKKKRRHQKIKAQRRLKIERGC